MTALEELRRLHEEATPGPWGAYGPDDQVGVDALGSAIDGTGGEITDRVVSCRPVADARLIATLRTVLPEVIALVEAVGDARPVDVPPDVLEAYRALHDALARQSGEPGDVGPT